MACDRTTQQSRVEVLGAEGRARRGPDLRRRGGGGQEAGAVRSEGLDWFSFIISFKGVFLEGVEVVFIVITFGLTAGRLPVAIVAAALGCALVPPLGIALRGPLSRVPENTLKYGVGLLLAAFGTFWAVEGLGIFTTAREP